MITEFVQKIVRGSIRIFCIFPIISNRILFNSQKGTQYACNPRFIYESLYKQNGNKLQYVWCLNNPPESLSNREGIIIVKYNSLRYFYYQMTSKVIVANIPSPCYVPRRKKQFMIDTWHGGGAYKRVGLSSPQQTSLSDVSNSIFRTTEASNNASWESYKAKYNAIDTSLFLSSSKRFTEVMFESQLLPRDAYLEIGMPRNDIFFKDTSFVEKKAKSKLGIDPEKKVILFAPTYRGNFKKQRNDIMLDIQMCLDAANDRWGGDWVFVYRMHIYSSSLDKEKIPTNAIDASGYDEMQELLCMADIFITDYSSSQWDYALTQKPGFLFTPDLDYYLNEDRGFYTPIDDWAFAYAKSNVELADLIRGFDESVHLKRVQRHMDLLGSFEDGHATEKVCDIIMKQIEQ